jgi:hypothetical protein
MDKRTARATVEGLTIRCATVFVPQRLIVHCGGARGQLGMSNSMRNTNTLQRKKLHDKERGK